MKTIKVKYLGPTNRKGSKLKAMDGDGNSVTIPYPSELNDAECFAVAALALCDKMDWPKSLVSGCYGGDYYFNFLKSDKHGKAE